jgi:hypothetical protein
MGGEDRKLRNLVRNKDKVISKCLMWISEHTKIGEQGLDVSYLDLWDLLPIAILCGISILFTVLWLLAVWEYVWLKDRGKHPIDGLAGTIVPDKGRDVVSTGKN